MRSFVYVWPLVLAAAISACGSVSSGECKAGATECVNDSVMRVCASDKTWVAQQCPSDQVCTNGACALSADIACAASQSTCTDSTHAIQCNANGKGFTSVACPAGTQCTGEGVCTGTCQVGSSHCNGSDLVQTCTDGFTLTDAACMPSQTTCVTTSAPTDPVQKAACMPMSCDPALGTVCGDKAADPNSTDPSYASNCVPSPQGYHWQSLQCPVANSCTPGGGCNTPCLAGQTRCYNNSVQTCGSDGTWGAGTACTMTATGQQQVCTYDGPAGTAVCGDPVCNSYPGACEADGYHPCVNGKVSETAQACTVGACQGGGIIGGFTGGSCQAECNPGDSKCDGDGAYQTCTNNHTWSGTTTSCPNNGTDHCVQFTDPSTNGQRAICGVCVPGSHRCTDVNGNPNGSPPTDIQSCDTTGHYAAYAACSVGQCQYSNGDYACEAQCVPGSTVCMGATTAPNPEHPGTTAYGMCTANGLLPTSGTNCPSNTACRKGPSGQPVGNGANACVTCVGPNIQGGNEIGLVDSYCTSSTQLETCTASNVWSTPTTCPTSSALNGQCKQESPYLYEYCNGYAYCHQSFLNSIGYSGGCLQYWGYPAENIGGSPDCCGSSYCAQVGPYSPNPAACQ